MTATRPTSDRDSCHRAWAAFRRHDAALTAPPELAARVRASVAAHTSSWAVGPPLPLPASRRTWAASIAAVLVAALASGAGFVWQASRDDAALVVSIPTSGGAPWAPYPATVVADVPSWRSLDPGTRDRAEPPPARVADVAAAAPSRSRVAAAVLPVEALQVIRVRIAASALDAFGVQVAGPMSAGLVDVDLVVGEDGWPRDVRRIRPVAAAAPPE